MEDIKANENLEQKIIETARNIFIERGFKDTSMSEIAAAVGINRPVLHYYFRTKEKMYQAVFGDIVLSVIPQIHTTMAQKDLTLMQRVSFIIDAYFELFLARPYLPLFMLREMQRDTDHLISTVKELGVNNYFITIKEIIFREMDSGRINKLPLTYLFYTFYGMLAIPFMTKKIELYKVLDDEEDFEVVLQKWKPFILSQMENLLLNPKSKIEE